MKKWYITAACVVFLVLSALVVGLVHDRRMDADFPSVRSKSSEIQVKQLLGEPREVNRQCRNFSVQLVANCDHIFVYRSSLTPLRDRYWLVFFDQNNQATATSAESEP
jgi:hypothetical protein